jgi:hypothetical protein
VCLRLGLKVPTLERVTIGWDGAGGEVAETVRGDEEVGAGGEGAGTVRGDEKVGAGGEGAEIVIGDVGEVLGEDGGVLEEGIEGDVEDGGEDDVEELAIEEEDRGGWVGGWWSQMEHDGEEVGGDGWFVGLGVEDDGGEKSVGSLNVERNKFAMLVWDELLT